MTVSRRDEQRNAEMERGRIIAEKARRKSDLARYLRSGRVTVVTSARPMTVASFSVDGVQVVHQCTGDDDYPSELVMATLALSMQAVGGLPDVPPPKPTHKVDDAGKAYNARLKEHNKHRWDNGTDR